MDKKDEFKKKLAGKQKKNMHLMFFDRDPKIMFIEVPIVTEHSGAHQIVPFRNLKCHSPKCVYSLDELLAKYEGGLYNSYINFVCKTCRTIIDLHDFYLDATLHTIIQSIWKTYNKEGQVICTKITIFQNGEWEPNVPEYLKKMEKKLYTNLMKLDGNNNAIENPHGSAPSLGYGRKIEGYNPNGPKLNQIEVHEKMPNLAEYREEEYKENIQKFKKDKASFALDGDVFLSKFGFKIKLDELVSLMNDSHLPVPVMNLFLKYLDNRAKAENNQNMRILILGAQVSSFDKSTGQANYLLMPNCVNPVKNQPSELSKRYNKVALVMHFDQRYTMAILDLEQRPPKLSVVDFMTSELCNFPEDQMLRVSKAIMAKEFGANPGMQSVIDVKKLTFFSDCGIHIANYLYKVIKNPGVESVRVSSSEKELFRRQMVWLLFRMTKTGSEKVLFFQFPNEPGGKLVAEESRMSSKRENSLPSIDLKASFNSTNKSGQMIGNNRNTFKLPTLGNQKLTMQGKHDKQLQELENAIMSGDFAALDDREMLKLSKPEMEHLMQLFKENVKEKVRQKKRKEFSVQVDSDEYDDEDGNPQEKLAMNLDQLKTIFREYKTKVINKFHHGEEGEEMGDFHLQHPPPHDEMMQDGTDQGGGGGQYLSVPGEEQQNPQQSFSKTSEKDKSKSFTSQAGIENKSGTVKMDRSPTRVVARSPTLAQRSPTLVAGRSPSMVSRSPTLIQPGTRISQMADPGADFIDEDKGLPPVPENEYQEQLQIQQQQQLQQAQTAQQMQQLQMQQAQQMQGGQPPINPMNQMNQMNIQQQNPMMQNPYAMLMGMGMGGQTGNQQLSDPNALMSMINQMGGGMNNLGAYGNLGGMNSMPNLGMMGMMGMPQSNSMGLAQPTMPQNYSMLPDLAIYQQLLDAANQQRGGQQGQRRGGARGRRRGGRRGRRPRGDYFDIRRGPDDEDEDSDGGSSKRKKKKKKKKKGNDSDSGSGGGSDDGNGSDSDAGSDKGSDSGDDSDDSGKKKKKKKKKGKK